MPTTSKRTKRGATVRQKRLAPLLAKVAQGKMTKADALRQAGYSEKTALQQSGPFGSIRNNAAMQQALRDAGFDEAFIAKKIVTGAKTLKPGKPQLGYVQAGAELLDVIPSKKIDHTVSDVDQLLDQAEAGEAVRYPEDSPKKK